MRRSLALVAAGLAVGIGCGLLTPYPGSGDPAEVLGAIGDGEGSPIEGGDPRDPLFDPAIDDSVTVSSNRDVIVANPGESFVIDLSFQALNRNVVGGGIQFPGSKEVQWTFIEGLQGEPNGEIRFAYAVPDGVCDEVPNRCHEIVTQQFAVVENTSGDVDGDGKQDGQFVVSQPATSQDANGDLLEGVRVVLRCATCESTSCQELLEAGECSTCTQPDDCAQAYELCFTPGKAKFGTSEHDLFELLLGEDGIAWRDPATCTMKDEVCEQALMTALEDCDTGDTDTDTDSGGATGGTTN